jgi:hypothetical protein
MHLLIGASRLQGTTGTKPNLSGPRRFATPEALGFWQLFKEHMYISPMLLQVYLSTSFYHITQ